MEVEGRTKPDTLKEVWRWIKQLLQDFLDHSNNVNVKKTLLFESLPDLKKTLSTLDKENEREKCLNMPQIMNKRSPSDQARHLLT